MKQLLGDIPTRLIAIIVLFALLLLAFLTVRILLVPVVAASFVAYLFEPAVISLQRRGMQRGLAFLLLLTTSVTAVVVVFALTSTWLKFESIERLDTEDISLRLDKQAGEFESWLSKRVPLAQSINLSSLIATRAGRFTETFFEELPALMTAFAVNLLLVPFIAYFMVRDGRRLRRRIVSMVPNRYFEMTLIVWHRIDQQIGGYLRGRLIECMLVGVTQVFVMGITSLFVPQPQILLISVVCGITNLVPYVGPLMGAGFGILLYLGAQGVPATAVYGLIVATLISHVIDNIAIAPVVLSHNVDLHPLTVALTLLIGGELLGILGLLIAVPVAASMKVIGQEVYSNYQLQNRPS
jgi:predicted PurR-regulated permease PerM